MLSKAQRFIYALELLPKLGIYNVAYTMIYKFLRKYNLLKRQYPIRQCPQGNFYLPCSPDTEYPDQWKSKLIRTADKIMSGKFTWFGYHEFELSPIPDWFYNPFDRKVHSKQTSHWTEIQDFDEDFGEIKIYWEISRFKWLLDLSRAFKITSENKYLERINSLLNDWSKNNPVNRGPNWMCGQETSIRVIRLITSSRILDQLDNATPPLLELVFYHLERIASNLGYAISQKNNHSISESAALYIGSLWLISNNYKATKLSSWVNKGRNSLEKSLKSLVQRDGTFSQRSTNYHRFVIDIFSFVIDMMHALNEPRLDQSITDILKKMARWQFLMILGKSGESPNFGNNDGAMIECLHCQPYIDFRPSLQLIYGLLYKKKLYNNIEVNEALYWRFGTNSMQLEKINESYPNKIILDNQILLMTISNAKVFMKLPENSFRPGNDAFHIDLWIDGKNILRDNGTYSYFSKDFNDVFNSVISHNTVQFDTHDQMPQISKFLYGKWIKLEDGGFINGNDDESLSWQGSYRDYKGNLHTRTVSLSSNRLSIYDQIETSQKAISRFHLTDHAVQINFNIECKDKMVESLSSCSNHYLHRIELPVKEIEFSSNSTEVLFTWN